MTLNISLACKASPLNGSVSETVLCLKLYQRGGKVRARGSFRAKPKSPEMHIDPAGRSHTRGKPDVFQLGLDAAVLHTKMLRTQKHRGSSLCSTVIVLCCIRATSNGKSIPLCAWEYSGFRAAVVSPSTGLYTR